MIRFTRLALFALLLCLPIVAHHSFSSEFDQDKPITFKGTVTKVEWMNPHAWFYVDVKGEDGRIVNYGCETGPPGMLTRNGWKKDSLKVGDEVTVYGFKSKDGSNNLSSRQVTLADGRKVFSGSADTPTK